MAEPTSTPSIAPTVATTITPPAIAAPHGMEKAVDRAERAAPELTAAVSESASTAPRDINAVDNALAAELDSLLEGDFETIDAVLHGSENPPTPTGVVGQSAAIPVSETPREQPAPGSAAAPLTTIEPSVALAIPPDLPVEVASCAPAIASPTMLVAAAAHHHPAPSDTTSISDRQSPSDGDHGTSTFKPLRVRSASLRQAVTNALMLINLPLRLVPPGFKPAVDWIALSLLVWVPIVWVLAFVIGPGNMSAHAGQLAEQDQSLHGESTIDAKGAHDGGGHESSSGGHDTKKASGGHDGGKSTSKSKDKSKSPPTKAAGNKLPTEKGASAKGKSKTTGSGAHH